MAKVTDTRKFEGSCGERKFTFTFSHPQDDRCTKERRQIALLTDWLETGGQLPLELNFTNTTQVILNTVTMTVDKPRKGATKASVRIQATSCREEDVQALYNLFQTGKRVQIVIREVPTATVDTKTGEISDPNDKAKDTTDGQPSAAVTAPVN